MKTNFSCEICEQELCAYIDGALQSAVAHALESHLGSCARCRLTLAAYRGISARLAALPEISAPPRLEARVVGAVTGAERRKKLWSRGFAAAAALSFAGTVFVVAYLPQLARQWGLPDPTMWPILALRGLVDAIVAVTQRLTLDVTFYGPMGRQLWLALHTLETIPRVALLTIRTSEVQVVGAVALTLGVAFYVALRPARTHEGGIGHACLSL